MVWYLSCALCCVNLEPGTQCDHAQYIYKEWETTETSTIIVKKSVFGNKTQEDVKKAQHSRHTCKCRCGTVMDLQHNDIHECTHYGILNTLRLVSHRFIPSHPSGFQHRRYCSTCKGEGTYEIPSYKPCPNCLGTGGLKCLACCGSGKRIGYTHQISCHCSGGYVEPCKLCSGHQAVTNGVTKLECKACIVSDCIVNVRPIEIINNPEISLSVTPPSPSQRLEKLSSLNIETTH